MTASLSLFWRLSGPRRTSELRTTSGKVLGDMAPWWRKLVQQHRWEEVLERQKRDAVMLHLQLQEEIAGLRKRHLGTNTPSQCLERVGCYYPIAMLDPLRCSLCHRRGFFRRTQNRLIAIGHLQWQNTIFTGH